MALTDPLMLQATLAIAAISRSLLHKQAIGLEVYFHQAETVRVLKDRLNEPNLVITDATICAVGCLMQLEVSPFLGFLSHLYWPFILIVHLWIDLPRTWQLHIQALECT